MVRRCSRVALRVQCDPRIIAADALCRNHAVNSGTLPVYYLLDLRVDRNYVFDRWKLNTYFELNNVYQRKNIVGYGYNGTYTTREPINAFVLPISFGVQGEF